MSSRKNKADKSRRDFLKQAGAGAAAVAGGALLAENASTAALAQSKGKQVFATGRVLGANDRINIGCIGVGGRGSSVMRWAMEVGASTRPAQIVAVCDVYRKRLNKAKEESKAEFATLDYREVIARKDIDVVIIATPDHWHAPIAIEAMKAGKDVYCEKPMTKTVEEAKRFYETAKATNRVVQIGSQTTSSDQWWKARKAIEDGMIGQLLMSQGSYHRNSVEGEWNWPIDQNAGPQGKGDDYIDWNMWLGSAPKRPYNADRFFRFRKYWDYSGGIATDLFYHVVAPLNICWGEPQFPHKVMASGGIYVFKDEREVPDTFHLIAEFPKGHSLVLSSSMANGQHIPGLIRGHEGTIMMVPGGQFEGKVDHITVTPERIAKKKFEEKFSSAEVVLATEQRENHMENFLRCVKSREKTVLDPLTAYKAMTTIAMSVQSYREGKALYFDERTERVTDRPVQVANG
ncbi:MAG TPA: Gfo/Idh/MocA family oxidoreductase [Blastocatellia bacterium]|nr:Gfo/Idh/MocA family oxidoreductase [Blastocatellia bacterium]